MSVLFSGKLANTPKYYHTLRYMYVCKVDLWHFEFAEGCKNLEEQKIKDSYHFELSSQEFLKIS